MSSSISTVTHCFWKQVEKKKVSYHVKAVLSVYGQLADGPTRRHQLADV